MILFIDKYLIFIGWKSSVIRYVWALQVDNPVIFTAVSLINSYDQFPGKQYLICCSFVELWDIKHVDSEGDWEELTLTMN